MTDVGVPLISPVEVENVRPAGSDGETDQETTLPPLEVGVVAVIAESLVSVNELGLYVIEEGMTSLTTTVIVAVALPPLLVAVTVYDADEVIAVGVPEITPVVVLKESPVGSDGDTDHVMTVPPLAVGAAGAIAASLVSVNGLPLYETDEGMTSLT